MGAPTEGGLPCASHALSSSSWAQSPAPRSAIAIATAEPNGQPVPSVPPVATEARAPAVERASRASVIQTDLWMTQAMGLPTASGPMFTGGVIDQQLEHSRDPGFLAELEQTQRDVDRMLGEGAP